MKRKMKKQIILSVLILGVMTLTAFAQGDPTNTFLEKAIMSNRYEVQMANQAMNKTTNDKVRQHAEETAQEHQKVLDKLEAYARERNVDVDQNLDREYQEKIDKLNTLEGEQYDEALNKNFTESREKSIQLFEEAANGNDIEDAELKKWIGETLPDMKKNLENTRSMNSQGTQQREGMFPKRKDNNNNNMNNNMQNQRRGNGNER